MYFIFAYDNYYPWGGLNDFLGSARSLDSAVEVAKRLIIESNDRDLHEGQWQIVKLAFSDEDLILEKQGWFTKIMKRVMMNDKPTFVLDQLIFLEGDRDYDKSIEDIARECLEAGI